MIHAFSGLLDISEVQAVDDADVDCLQEISRVLKKHGMEKRFGVNLLHKHFEVEEGEMLTEFCDVDKRTLTVLPTKMSALGKHGFRPTSWRLDTGQPIMNCVCRVVQGEHTGQHMDLG